MHLSLEEVYFPLNHKQNSYYCSAQPFFSQISKGYTVDCCKSKAPGVGLVVVGILMSRLGHISHIVDCHRKALQKEQCQQHKLRAQ